MSCVMPFTFNAVNLYVVIINGKPWTCARVLCRALKYDKSTKAADIVKHLCSQENYTQKCQLIKFNAVGNFADWPKGSGKDQDEDQKTWAFLQAEERCHSMTSSREDAQDHDMFTSLTDASR